MWSVKLKYVIRLERNPAMLVGWMYNVRFDNSMSSEEFSTRLKLNSMRECFRIQVYNGLVIYKKLKTGQVSKDPAKDRNGWNLFIRTGLFYANRQNRC